MAPKILIVEDEDELRELLSLMLPLHGYQVVTCADGTSAFQVFKEANPDLILLDWQLPGKSGIEVCREIREVSGVPIIMVTARTDSEDLETGLKAGADDYVEKPFDEKKLLVRISATLGRSQRPVATSNDGESEDFVRIGPLMLDVVGHEVRRGDEKVSLTPLEFTLLLTLARKPKQVFTREALLEQVWGYHYKADTRLVNVHIQRLRSKIEDDPDNPKIVTTVRGIGYKAGQN
ncbi:MAG: MtrAB system response regulator MtrA [Micrococcales bacterium]